MDVHIPFSYRTFSPVTEWFRKPNGIQLSDKYTPFGYRTRISFSSFFQQVNSSKIWKMSQAWPDPNRAQNPTHPEIWEIYFWIFLRQVRSRGWHANYFWLDRWKTASRSRGSAGSSAPPSSWWVTTQWWFHPVKTKIIRVVLSVRTQKV